MSSPAIDATRPRSGVLGVPVAGAVAGVVALAGFLTLARLAWHSTQPLTWERPIITGVRHVPFPTRDFWISLFEPLPFSLTTAALVCAALARRRVRLAAGGLLGCAVAIGTAELVVKPVVDRVRTLTFGPRHHVVQFGGNMFPSAHVTAAAAFATFAFLLLGRPSWRHAWVYALPLVVGVAVISKGMHDPADVLGALILGPGVALAVVHVVTKPRALDAPPGAEPPEPARPLEPAATSVG